LADNGPNQPRAGALVGGGGAGEVEQPLSDGMDWRWACGFFASAVTDQCQRFAATLFAWNEATALPGYHWTKNRVTHWRPQAWGLGGW